MITFTQKGSFSSTEKFLKSNRKNKYRSIVERYAKEGVNALSAATPVRTGLTSRSWTYQIKETETSITITWTNTNIKNGVNIAIILQYGHGTKNGGFVQGIDYINPAMGPIFQNLADAAWKEVTAV